MNAPKFLSLPSNMGLAYHKSSAQGDGVNRPGLIFLGGYNSDMTGTKARYLEDWASKNGAAFIRFDYRGHGVSSGRFQDHCVGDWADDAAEVLQRLAEGPQIVVGSSMGGWIALLLAKRFPERIAGLIGIAAAPDFTQWRWEGFTDAQRKTIAEEGLIELPSQYSEDPYFYTHRLFRDGPDHFVLNQPLPLPIPVRLLHGTADPDVPHTLSMRLLEHVTCTDATLTLIKDGDHRLSDPADLDLLGRTVREVWSKSTR